MGVASTFETMVPSYQTTQRH